MLGTRAAGMLPRSGELALSLRTIAKVAGATLRTAIKDGLAALDAGSTRRRRRSSRRGWRRRSLVDRPRTGLRHDNAANRCRRRRRNGSGRRRSFDCGYRSGRSRGRFYCRSGGLRLWSRRRYSHDWCGGSNRPGLLNRRSGSDNNRSMLRDRWLYRTGRWRNRLFDDGGSRCRTRGRSDGDSVGSCGTSRDGRSDNRPGTSNGSSRRRSDNDRRGLARLRHNLARLWSNSCRRSRRDDACRWHLSCCSRTSSRRIRRSGWSRACWRTHDDSWRRRSRTGGRLLSARFFFLLPGENRLHNVAWL